MLQPNSIPNLKTLAVTALPRLSMRRSLILLAAFFSSFVASAQQPTWHLGSFRGALKTKNEELLWRVECSTPNGCQVYSKAMRPIEQAESLLSEGGAVITPVIIPNGNLSHTRQVVSEDTTMYERSEFAPQFQDLRSLLASKEEFTSCVSISQEEDQLVLCALASDPQADRSLILLIGTMNAACGTQPFCAYVFTPLYRKK